MRKALLAVVFLVTACDIGEPTTADLSSIQPIATCAVVLQCENSCDDTACTTSCDEEASPSSLPLVKALHACVANACPNVGSDMGPSDMGPSCSYEEETGTFDDPTSCNACVRAAQSSGGACVTALAECAAATS